MPVPGDGFEGSSHQLRWPHLKCMVAPAWRGKLCSSRGVPRLRSQRPLQAKGKYWAKRVWTEPSGFIFYYQRKTWKSPGEICFHCLGKLSVICPQGNPRVLCPAPPPHLLCSSLPSSLGVNVSRVPGDRSGWAGDAEGQGCPLWPDF